MRRSYKTVTKKTKLLRDYFTASNEAFGLAVVENYTRSWSLRPRRVRQERPDWANQMSLRVVCHVLLIGSGQDGLVAILGIQVLVGVWRG